MAVALLALTPEYGGLRKPVAWAESFFGVPTRTMRPAYLVVSEPMGPAPKGAQTRSKTMYEKELAEMRKRVIRETEEFLSRRLRRRPAAGPQPRGPAEAVTVSSGPQAAGEASPAVGTTRWA